ncbi:MAG: hypothetical protein ACT4N4_18340 [Rhodospirillales bacterium]
MHSDGLDMLLCRAMRGFEPWFGVEPKATDELRRIVVEAMLKKK